MGIPMKINSNQEWQCISNNIRKLCQIYHLESAASALSDELNCGSISAWESSELLEDPSILDVRSEIDVATDRNKIGLEKAYDQAKWLWHKPRKQQYPKGLLKNYKRYMKTIQTVHKVLLIDSTITNRKYLLLPMVWGYAWRTPLSLWPLKAI